MDEARKVIRRLERIEALQSAEVPVGELLGEVRQLLAEGEAWLAAERVGASEGPTDGAAAALAGCRRTLTRRKEAVPETADAASL